MVIDFSKMEDTILHEFKGGKKDYVAKMYSDESAKIMYGKLEPGASIGMHTHETSCEMIYILSGTAEYIYDGQPETVTAGGCHYCPKGHTHTMMNNSNEDLIFFAVVPEQ